MYDSGLPENMWDLALNTAVYAYNRTPHASNNMVSPIHVFKPDHKVDIAQLKRFGCIAYMKIQRKSGPKFRFIGRRVVLVGYKETGYLLLKPEEGKIYESRDVRFNEKLVFGNRYKKAEISDWETVNSEIDTNSWFVEFETETTETEGETKRSRVRPRKLREVTSKKTEPSDKTTHVLLAEMNDDPVNYHEAMKATDKLKWTETIKAEIDSMYKNKVWKLVDRDTVPSDGKRQNIMDSRWVLKKKIESDGNFKYKARLVIRGFKDKNEYDLQETYAPISRLPLIRMILAIGNKYNFEL